MPEDIKEKSVQMTSEELEKKYIDEITKSRFATIQKNVFTLYENEKIVLAKIDRLAVSEIEKIESDKKSVLATTDNKIAVIDNSFSAIRTQINKKRDEGYAQIDSEISRAVINYNKLLDDAKISAAKHETYINAVILKINSDSNQKKQELVRKYQALESDIRVQEKKTVSERESITSKLNEKYKNEQDELDDRYKKDRQDIESDIRDIHDRYFDLINSENDRYNADIKDINLREAHFMNQLDSSFNSYKATYLERKGEFSQFLESARKQGDRAKIKDFERKIADLDRDFRSQDDDVRSKKQSEALSNKKNRENRLERMKEYNERQRVQLIDEVCLQEQKIRDLDARYVVDKNKLECRRKTDILQNTLSTQDEIEGIELLLFNNESDKKIEDLIENKECLTKLADVDQANEEFKIKRDKYQANCTYNRVVYELNAEIKRRKVDTEIRNLMEQKEVEYKIAKANEERNLKLSILNRNDKISGYRLNAIAATSKSFVALEKKIGDQVLTRVKYHNEPVRQLLMESLLSFKTKLQFLVKSHQMNNVFLYENIDNSYYEREKNLIGIRSEEAKVNENRGVENANKDFLLSFEQRHKEKKEGLRKSIDNVNDIYKRYLQNVNNMFQDQFNKINELFEDINNEVTEYSKKIDANAKTAEEQLLRNSNYYKLILQQQIDMIEDFLTSSISTYQNDLQLNKAAIELDLDNNKKYIEKQIEEKRIEFEKATRFFDNLIKKTADDINTRKGNINSENQKAINGIYLEKEQRKQRKDRIYQETAQKNANIISSLNRQIQQAENAFSTDIINSQLLTKENVKINVSLPVEIKKDTRWWIRKTKVETR